MEKTVQHALILVVLIGLLFSACEARRRPKDKEDPSRKVEGNCSGDLFYSRCGGCQEACGERRIRCPRRCHQGCYCPDGQLLRSKGSNVCVKVCPNALDANIAE